MRIGELDSLRSVTYQVWTSFLLRQVLHTKCLPSNICARLSSQTYDHPPQTETVQLVIKTLVVIKKQVHTKKAIETLQWFL